ncbi:RNA polymerase sigma factor [Tahibacter amnicola]|uniref:Sigma-70 family RNA polymerase sigma factor n=1 Tax=Tahibacter amnicola TaxID=2976241 RepID=A0ABY6BC08_9GAMM|nr:sigma-70 family RNA polymerase sigma factor [Tahibacter amnicola]UXI67579.1 sigma-70 family RNA polymerase sigma factor [Tahibacter amnicola]
MERSSFAIDVPQSLLERAQRGELRAFEQIYRLFERPVYSMAFRLLNDADVAREILHDAMLKLFQRLSQFRGDAPFWGWLRQIALNEALMRLRKDKRLEFDAVYDEVESETAAPWVHADAIVLEQAMAKLPAVTRSVLWLFHVEGYSHPEIAEALSKTTSFSKSQVARGTARLRTLLADVTESAPCLIAATQPG